MLKIRLCTAINAVSYRDNLTRGDTDPVPLGLVCVHVCVCVRGRARWHVYHSFEFFFHRVTVLKIRGFPVIHLG